MRTLLLVIVALAVAGPLAAQRRLRLGPVVSTIALDEGASGSHSYSSFGGTLAFLSSEDGEIGIAVGRYGDLSSTTCVRKMTFVGLESNYYPVGPDRIAPFASTTVGIARVTDQDIQLAGGCGIISTPPAPSTEIGIAFGLGVRVNVGSQVVGLVEGRFFQVPNSAIQALEGRANVSFAFGKPRPSTLMNGTIGPVAGMMMRLGGPLEGRGPTLGIRFRRDTKKAQSLGLQIDYAPLEVRAGCSSNCRPYAILFAPGYEPSLHPAWGRLYLDFGFLLAGFPAIGEDRGMAQGAHGGLGADIVSSSLMWNVNARVLWLQRSTGSDRNAYLLQAGVSVSRPIESR